MNTSSLSLAFALATCCSMSLAAQPPAVVTTFSDGNIVAVLPQPDVGLPAPVQQIGSGMADTLQPHGLDFLRAGEVLVADFALPQLIRLRIADATAIDAIALPPRTSANGTLAVSPNGDYALSFGQTVDGLAESAVVSGFASGAISVQAGAPNLLVRSYSTMAIDFERTGRAYVCHANGVAALDPPYTTAAFDLPLPSSDMSVCRLSRDDQHLFVTRASAGIGVATAPFSSTTTPVMIAAPAGTGALGAIGVAPDGSAVLIAQVFATLPGTASARLFLLRAPYTPTSTLQELTLPEAIAGEHCLLGLTDSITTCPGFEDISISPDGRLAIVTGNSAAQLPSVPGRAPLLVITNPFDDATRTMHAVTIGNAGQANEGRGTGAARIEPADLRLFADGFEH